MFLKIFQSDRIQKSYCEKIHCSLRIQEFRIEFDTGCSNDMNGFNFQIIESFILNLGEGGGGTVDLVRL